MPQTLAMLSWIGRAVLLRFLPRRLLPILTVIEVARMIRAARRPKPPRPPEP